MKERREGRREWTKWEREGEVEHSFENKLKQERSATCILLFLDICLFTLPPEPKSKW